MNLNEEVYRFIEYMLYQSLGQAIFIFEDSKEYLDKSNTGYTFDNVILFMMKNNETGEKTELFAHIIYFDDGYALPRAYYNVEKDERTLTKKRKRYPEAVTSGYYREWRFVPEKVENL